MRYLGLDLGTRTLGISISDTTKTIATALKTIRFNDSDYDSIIPDIKDIIDEYEISKIVLGLPKNMNNTMGDRCATTIEFQKKLIDNFNIEVVLQDERLTTVEATNYMLQADVSRKKRKKKIDSYLDREKGGKL